MVTRRRITAVHTPTTQNRDTIVGLIDAIIDTGEIASDTVSVLTAYGQGLPYALMMREEPIAIQTRSSFSGQNLLLELWPMAVAAIFSQQFISSDRSPESEGDRGRA
jgi:hypothetical protein